MKISLAAVCDYAIVDQHGKLSVIGIFQHIWVGKFPAVHPRVHLVLKLEGKRTEIGQHKIDIRFTDSEGKALIQGGGSVTFNEPKAGVTTIEANAVLVFDIPFPQPGKYQFEIRVDEDVETILPVTAAEARGKRPQSPDEPVH